MGIKKPLTLVIKTAEFSMTTNISFNEQEPESESEKEKRIVRILELFSRLSPDMQEDVIGYIESSFVVKDRKTDEQDSTT
ncbi:hypothetical protein ES705_19813 [subsurface metagenome]